MKLTKKWLSLFLAMAMVFSVISPNFVLDVHAQAATLKYATNEAVTITSGSGRIDASSDIDSYKNLEEASVNLTATFTGSGVQSMFFLGNSAVSTNYYTWYVSGSTLGVEVYNASNSKVVNQTVVLSNMDLTKEHKYSLVHAKNADNSYTVTMYVDGAVVLSNAVTVGFSQGTLDAANFVGYGNGARNGNTYPMSGTIKDVEFYNSALSAQEVMDYVTKDRSDLVFDARNIVASESGTALDSEAVDTLKTLDEGTINIRYRVKDASIDAKMSLLKVTSSTSNNGFEVWVNPKANTYGLVVNGTNMPITNHSGVNDTKWHTITIRGTQSETKIGDNAGLHLTLDGNYIEGNRYTGNGRIGFFTLVNEADSFVVAGENFDGAIDSVKVYSGVLDNDEISAKANELAYEGGLIVDPNGTYRSEEKDIFYPTYDLSANYRIPALLTTKEGTVIAAIDQRNTTSADYGNIDTVVRRKEMDETAFGDAIEVIDAQEVKPNQSLNPMLIDPALVQDRDSGRIFMLVDMFPESSGMMNSGIIEASAGATTINGKSYYLVYKNGTPYGTIREGGKVYDMNGLDTGYSVITECEAPYRELGDIYFEGELQGNVYVFTQSADNYGPFQMLRTQRLWLTYSDDDGKSWSCPQDITAQVKPDWCMFVGVGPGVGLQLTDGTLAFPVYTCNKTYALNSQASALIISEDGGNTWKLSGSPQEPLGRDPETISGGLQLTESQLIQLNDGTLKLFMRNGTGKVYVSTSTNKGMTWSDTKAINVPNVYCQLSVTHYTKGDEEWVILSNPAGPGRNNGKVFLGKVLENGEVDFDNGYTKQINWQKYCYSCIQVVDITTTQTNETNAGKRDVLAQDNTNPMFGLLYEDDTNSSMDLFYIEFDEAWVKAEMVEKQQGTPELVSYNVVNENDTYTLTLTFDQAVMVAGDVSLEVSDGSETKVLSYVSGSATNVITFAGEITTSGNGIFEVTNIDATNGYFENALGDKVVLADKIEVADFSKLSVASVTYSSQHSASTAENTDGAAVNAIDGNPNTYWHSTWGNNAITLPQHLVLNLNEAKTFNALYYVPRQNGTSGRVKQYEILTSSDGTNFTSLKTGELDGGANPSIISFDEVTTQYVKFVVNTSTVDGSCAIAELIPMIYTVKEGSVNSENLDMAMVEAEAILENHADLFTKASIENVKAKVDSVNNAALTTQSEVDALEKDLRNAVETLTFTRGIKAAIAKAENLNAQDYSEASWANLQSVVADAKANYENDLSQQESTKRIMAIEYAIDQLIDLDAKVDKTQLQALYDLYKDKEEATYTAATWAPFKAALDAAKAVLDNADATQDEVNSAKANLETTANGLVEDDGIPELGTLINTEENKGIVNILGFSSQCGADTGVSEGAGGGEADKVLDYNTSTYWHTDWRNHTSDDHYISFDLGKVYDLSDITFLPRQGSSYVNGDIFEMDVYVSEDETFDENDKVGNFTYEYSGYNLVSRDFHRAYLSDAKGRYVKLAILNSGGDSNRNGQFASMAEIRFYGEESTSVTPPVEADKVALQAKIAQAQAIDADDYTADSYAALEAAVAAAKVVNEKADATQVEVDGAVQAITDAMKALVEKTPVDPEPTVDKEALKAAIEAAKEIDTTNKTDDSVAALASALTAAEAIVAKEDATQDEVDAAKDALEAAVAGLKDKPVDPKPVMDFYDVQDKKAWFYGSVESAFTKGLMGATGKEPVNGKPFFEPDTPISRGMVATVLYRMAGQPKVEFKATFSDVTNAKLWYSTAITWASQAGVVSGYKDGSFGPDDNITRQDLAIMLRNYAKSCGLDTNVKVDFSAFKDGNKVVSYAQSAVQFCIDAKLMSGAKKADGVYLNPSDKATRAECAKMFSLLDDAIKAHNAK